MLKPMETPIYVSRRRTDGLPAAVLAVVVASLAACEVTEPFLTGTNERPENLGTEIAGSAGVTEFSLLKWAPDGATLLFEAGTPASLRAANIETGQVVTVDGPRGDYIDVDFASDGRSMVFSTNLLNGSRTTYILRDGATTVLTDRAPGTFVTTPADGVVVLPATSGDAVAYIVRPDSLFLYDAVTGARRFIAADCTRVIAFAPAEDMVLCRGGTAAGPFNRVRLADGEVTAIDLLPREASILKVIRWEEDAILTLYQTATRFRVRNVQVGTTTTIWAPGFSQSYRVLDFINYAWSNDGRRFAFWLHECLRIDRVGACAFGQSVLHAVDMEANTGMEVAVAKGPRGGEQIAISPDRRFIAFVFDGRIRLQPIS